MKLDITMETEELIKLLRRMIREPTEMTLSDINFRSKTVGLAIDKIEELESEVESLKISIDEDGCWG